LNLVILRELTEYDVRARRVGIGRIGCEGSGLVGGGRGRVGVCGVVWLVSHFGFGGIVWLLGIAGVGGLVRLVEFGGVVGVLVLIGVGVRIFEGFDEFGI